MADQFDTLEDAIRAARAAAAFVDQASALLNSQAGDVTFCCSNPPYMSLFELTLPRSVWGPELQKQVDASNSTIDAATGASQSVVRA